jgi:hypothetical protein
MASTVVSKNNNHFVNVNAPRVYRCRKFRLIELMFSTLGPCVSDAEGWVDVERYGKPKLIASLSTSENAIQSYDTLGGIYLSK